MHATMYRDVERLAGGKIDGSSGARAIVGLIGRVMVLARDRLPEIVRAYHHMQEGCTVIPGQAGIGGGVGGGASGLGCAALGASGLGCAALGASGLGCAALGGGGG